MKLSKENIKSYLLSLPNEEQTAFIEELRDLTNTARLQKTKLSRCEMLNNKQGACPHA